MRNMVTVLSKVIAPQELPESKGGGQEEGCSQITGSVIVDPWW